MRNLVIAWRNLWRNKRRTLITIAAVVMVVFFSAVMSSMQNGTYSHMIDNIVKLYSGYLQIHQKDYWDSKSINDSFELSDSLMSEIKSVNEVEYTVPRLESFTLISTGENTKGGALIGIDPEKENALTGLSKWVVEGDYLKPGDNGVLLTVTIAKNLKADVGDTLIFLSQGYHGATAAGLYTVTGILKFPSPALNNMGAYMDLDQARQFFSMPDALTSLVLMVKDYEDVNKSKHILSKNLDRNYKVMTWEEMQPELVQMIEGDKAGGVIMKAILYLVIGFGLLGTIIMMTAERKRESAIMVAIGMQKHRLAVVYLYECMFIGILGIILGLAVTIPLVAYYYHNPILLTGEYAKTYEMFGIEPYMYFSMSVKVFLSEIYTVVIITLITSIYPIFKALSLNVVKSMKS